MRDGMMRSTPWGMSKAPKLYPPSWRIARLNIVRERGAIFRHQMVYMNDQLFPHEISNGHLPHERAMRSMSEASCSSRVRVRSDIGRSGWRT